MDITGLEQLGTLIGTIGFPSLVAIILLRTVLVNFNQRLDMLDKRLLQLNKSITMVAKTLDEHEKNSSHPSE